jgi:hypothetical protein
VCEIRREREKERRLKMLFFTSDDGVDQIRIKVAMV